MARALRRTALTLPLAALVGLSTLLHWLAGRRVTGLWIMPDEAIYGTRALQLWQHGPSVLVHSPGYSLLYPALAGLPLSAGTLPHGYALTKALQALVMSLAAWPVYTYSLQLVRKPYALVAAAATLAAPILLYSGLLMTEVLYYPLGVAALLAIARAVATTTLRHQAVALALVAAAVAARLQGIVLVAVFAASVLVEALLQRRRPPWRAFWPVWVLLAVGAAIVAAAPSVLGAYAPVVRGGYPVGSALRLVYEHFAYLAGAVALAPAAALVLLLATERRAERTDPLRSALLAVTATATVLIVAQVGIFASRYSPHLLGRDIAVLPPLYFVVFAVWLAAGSPRPRVVTSATVLGLLALLVLAPWNSLADPMAFPDTLDLGVLLRNPVDWSPATTVAMVGAILLALVRLVPRPALLSLAVVAALVGSTVAASGVMRDVVASTQAAQVGVPRDWVERAAGHHAAFVYDGDLSSWTVVWQQRFWNPFLDRVVSIAPNFVPGPVTQRQVSLSGRGTLPIGERYAVANNEIAMVGEPVARQSRGFDQYGLTLWKLTPPARVSTIASGFKPNGDVYGTATVTAYDCAGGALQLTLLPKTTDKLRIDLDGRPVVHEDLDGRPSWSTTIPVPSTHGPAPCRFTIVGGPLLGSTLVQFARPG